MKEEMALDQTLGMAVILCKSTKGRTDEALCRRRSRGALLGG